MEKNGRRGRGMELGKEKEEWQFVSLHPMLGLFFFFMFIYKS